MKLEYVALTAALATDIATAGAGRAQAVGYLSGAVAGHYAGHHAVLGAIGGCVAGHEIARHREEKKRMQEGRAPSEGV